MKLLPYKTVSMLCISLAFGGQRPDSVSAICGLEGVKGLRFGMTRAETREVPLAWKYSSKDALANKLGLTSVDELSQVTDTGKIDDFLAMHKSSFAGYSAEGLLNFVNDSLMLIGYVFEVETQNENKYVDAYFDLKSILTKKYGDPLTKEYLSGIWKDHFPKGDHAGFALSRGYGLYKSQWSCLINQTHILLALSGDNQKLSLILKYIDQKYDISKEKKEKVLLDEF